MRGQRAQRECRRYGQRLPELLRGRVVTARRRLAQRHLTEESSRHCLDARRGVPRGEFKRAGSELPRVFDTADEEQSVSETRKDHSLLRRRGHGSLPVGRLVQEREGFGLTAGQRVRFGKEGHRGRAHHRETVFPLNVERVNEMRDAFVEASLQEAHPADLRERKGRGIHARVDETDRLRGDPSGLCEATQRGQSGDAPPDRREIPVGRPDTADGR